mgnify:FL=1
MTGVDLGDDLADKSPPLGDLVLDLGRGDLVLDLGRGDFVCFRFCWSGDKSESVSCSSNRRRYAVKIHTNHTQSYRYLHRLARGQTKPDFASR